MKVGGEDEIKYFLDWKLNLLELSMKYGRLVVFIRHDYAEIWGFRYGFTLIIGTRNIMAGTGVLVRVVCALKRSIKNFTWTKSTIFT